MTEKELIDEYFANPEHVKKFVYRLVGRISKALFNFNSSQLDLKNNSKEDHKMATKNTNVNNISKFKKAAQDATVLCQLMSGREKLETDDVVGKTLTITAFDFAPKFDKNGGPIIDDATGLVETYGVITFKEMPDKYYNCGVVFSKVCRAWMSGYESAGDASADLAAEGGVKVEFKMSKTKAGNNLVTCEIV